MELYQKENIYGLGYAVILNGKILDQSTVACPHDEEKLHSLTTAS